MTEREREVFNLIEKDPMISQAELAAMLGITRASVGVHVSNLMKKGYIKGKGYITITEHPITVIGGANVDYQGKTDHIMIMADSNPGKINHALGGVGRNIAENLSMLDVPVRLITAMGGDAEASMVRENAVERGIDIEDCLILANERTSTYLYILDHLGDMVTAVSDMSITNRLNEDFLRTKLMKIDKSAYTVIDANLPEASIHFLVRHLQNTKLIFDTVSTTKALRGKAVLDGFYGIKPNLIEAEVLLERKILTNKDIELAGEAFLNMGIKKVFITLGKKGVYFTDGEHRFFRSSKVSEVVNVTGAGDAFTAAMVYALQHQLKGLDFVDFCLGASGVTVMSKDTIARNMSVDNIKQMIKEC